MAKIQYNKAALLYGPNDVRVEILENKPLSSREVRLRVKAATTCGTDQKTVTRGGHPKIMKTLPSPFGHEFCGEIAEVGSDVSNFSVGDRVVVANSAPCDECFFCKKEEFNLCENIEFINGGYSQYVTIPERFVKRSLHRIPEGLDFSKATLSEPLACVLYSSERVSIKEGETVAIIGTGPMAFLFLQVVLAKKAIPFVIGRNEERLQMAKEEGANFVLSNKEAPPFEELKSLTQGQGCDVVIEAVGKPETWTEALSYARKGGRICFYGGCKKGSRADIDTYMIHYNELTLFGVFHYTPSVIKRALNLLAEGFIRTELFNSQVRSLEQVSGIFLGEEQETRALKFLIDPSL